MLSFVFLLVFVLFTVTYSMPLSEERQEVLSDSELAAKHEAMERPGLYGGDILGGDENEIHNEGAGRPWPNAVVPYMIDRSLERHREKLLRAIREFEQNTCLKFRVASGNEGSYILLKDGDGCNSYVGTIGRRAQPVNLQINGCLSHSTIVHELGHAIGLLHTHQRSDRDDYIKVYLENVQDYYKSAFDKERGGSKYVDYDLTSVMHYDSYAASKNRQPTMTTLNGGIIRDPPGLSSQDIRAIKMHYRC